MYRYFFGKKEVLDEYDSFGGYGLKCLDNSIFSLLKDLISGWAGLVTSLLIMSIPISATVNMIAI